MKPIEFERKLLKFSGLLKKEKEYLIKGQAEKLTELVAQKEEYIPLFNAYTEELTEKSRILIQQIQQQQAENLLLTQQAMSYQETLMNAVKETMQKSTNQTYANPSTTSAVQAPTTLVDAEF